MDPSLFVTHGSQHLQFASEQTVLSLCLNGTYSLAGESENPYDQ